MILSSPTNGTIGEGSATVTIGASGATPVASPNISAPPNVLVNEADGYVDLPVALSAPATGTVSVNYATANSTAGASTGCDYNYVGTSGTLTFTPGVTIQVVRVDILNCKLGGLATFLFNLSAASGGVIIRPSTQVGIVGDASPTASAQLDVRGAVTDAGAGSVLVPVLLNGFTGIASTQTVTVDYATADATAKAGSDYTSTSGTLTFTPGQTVQNISVPILEPSASEPSRSFSVILSSPTNGTIGEGSATVTIGASGATPVASPNISVPATASVWQADGYVDLPVALSAPATGTVSVNYATANSTAGAGTGCDYNYVGTSGTLTFTPGVTIQVVRVDILNCGATSVTTFTFTLTSPVNAAIAQATTTVSINFFPVGTTAIVGKVLYPVGDGTGPVSGSQVEACDSSGCSDSQGTSDSTGLFTILVPGPGDYTVSAVRSAVGRLRTSRSDSRAHHG